MPRIIRVILISILLIFISTVFPNISVGAATTYLINGNAGVEEAILSYFDGSPKFVISDSDGNYSLSVASNWSGKIVPSKTGHSFTPVSIDYADVTADQLSQNYSASDNTCEPYGNAGETSRISLLPNGTTGNSATYMPKISANGCYTAFYSDASNLVDADVNNVGDIFIRNMSTRVINLVSVSSSGVQGNSANRSTDDNIAISADGRYVAFNTTADNLVDGDINGYRDVFLHDTHTGTTILISKSSNGIQARNGDSYYPSISADGRYIAFASRATNLFNGDTNARSDVFVHDALTGITSLVSINSSGTLGDNASNYPSISADGRYIAFESYSSNLIAEDTNPDPDIFVRDLQTSTTFLASLNSSGVQADNGVKTAFSYQPAISANGRYVAFTSQASNLVSGDTNAKTDIFLRDIILGTTERISVSNSGTQANSATERVCSISADGRYVVFSSMASNLVSGDADGGVEDVFLRDRAMGVIRQLQFPSTLSTTPDISANGQYVMVLSIATSWDGFVYINDITSPTTSGIEDVTVNQDAQNASIDLWEAFADAENSDSTLAYTITGNTNPSLFTSTTTPTPGEQYLVLDFDPETIGSTTMTVRATDPAGLFVETSFMVSVMGNVMISGNTEVGGVTLSYTDVTSKISTSNLDGNYSFTVPYNWNGTVTASKSGYTFSPSRRIYTNVSADQMGQNYLSLLVTNTNDNGPGSLHHIVTNAITGDTITFAPSLSGQAIHLSSSLLIDKGITIDGSSLTPHIQVSGDTDNDGTGDVAVFRVEGTPPVELNGLDIVKGKASGTSGGGGITNYGTLTIKKSNISANSYGGDISGGGIYNEGNLTIADSTLTSNSAYAGPGGSSGGAINNHEGNVVIKNCTFTGNSASEGGAVYNEAQMIIIGGTFNENSSPKSGGGITNFGTLTLTDSILSSNSAHVGGGIANSGDLTITNTDISGNSAEGGVGGVMNDNNGMLTIANSVISNNTSSCCHGGILNASGTVNISNSTVSGNSATSISASAPGGGISNWDTLIATNVTFSGNSAGYGGGILNLGTSYITNNTISGNSASISGGGIYNDGTLNYTNTIIANSTSGGDCYNETLYTIDGIINTNIHNLVENNAASLNQCGTPFLSSDPKLGPLADNGGSTQTMALLPGSPTIDAGDDDTCETTDQRGVSRPQGSHCDIGAFEYIDNTPPLIFSITHANTNPTSASSVDFTVTFSEPVTSVDMAGPQFDGFSLTTSSGISGAAIVAVSGSGATYIVTVNTGNGNGSIRLDVPATTTATDLVGNPLANLPFTDGESYAIETFTAFSSAATTDGWILETRETSNLGGLKNANSLLRAGDDVQNRQYRSILSFDTSSLPDDAVILQATLKVKRAGITGTSPFKTHGGLLADMAKGSFGRSALDGTDFQAQGSKQNIGVFAAVAGETDWYQLIVSSTDFKYVSLNGTTQFRLRFSRDDDNDRKADFISFYGGEDVVNPPQLIVEYTTP